MLWILTLSDPPLANLPPVLLAAFSTPLAMSLMVKKLSVDLDLPGPALVFCLCSWCRSQEIAA